MSDYERSRRSREEREDRDADSYPPRRPQPSREPEVEEPVRRRSASTAPDESPAPRSRYADEPVPAPRTRSTRSHQESEDETYGRTSGGRSDRGSSGRYSDRFRDAPEKLDERDSRESASSRDPYDRLRRTQGRPPRRVEPDPYDDQYLDPDDYDDVEPLPGRGRSRARRGAAVAGAGAVAVAGAAGMRKMGSRLTNPRADERALMYGITAAGASLVLLLLMIAIRYGSAPDWIPVDINAEGTVLTFGTKAAIWRLPVFALFSSLMALGLAWWLREREPFATQFLAVGAIMINIIVWVGAITLLW